MHFCAAADATATFLYHLHFKVHFWLGNLSYVP
jgi:hypothetical protein